MNAKAALTGAERVANDEPKWHTSSPSQTRVRDDFSIDDFA